MSQTRQTQRVPQTKGYTSQPPDTHAGTLPNRCISKHHRQDVRHIY